MAVVRSVFAQIRGILCACNVQVVSDKARKAKLSAVARKKTFRLKKRQLSASAGQGAARESSPEPEAQALESTSSLGAVIAVSMKGA